MAVGTRGRPMETRQADIEMNFIRQLNLSKAVTGYAKNVCAPIIVAMLFIYLIDFEFKSASATSIPAGIYPSDNIPTKMGQLAGMLVLFFLIRSLSSPFLSKVVTSVCVSALIASPYLRTYPTNIDALEFRLGSVWRAGYIAPVAWYYLNPYSACAKWTPKLPGKIIVCRLNGGGGRHHDAILVRSSGKRLPADVYNFDVSDREVLVLGDGITARTINEVDWIFGSFYLVRLYCCTG
jgi:hypothetical protein